MIERHLEMHPADTAATLAWLVTAGVDTPVDEAPRHWLKAAPAPLAVPALAAQAKFKPSVTVMTQAPDGPSFDAPTLDSLALCVDTFVHPLRRSDIAATLLCGNAASGVIILCDQPEPEGSSAAALRTRMLAAIGLNTTNCALLHRLPWPTTGARAPRPDELAAFEPFVVRALELSSPRLVLALGQHAAAIAGDAMAMASARGRWATVLVSTTVIPLLATCHPRLLLSQPARKREAWADLEAFAARLAVTI